MNPDRPISKETLLGPAVVIGFGTTVAVWSSAFLFHVPGLRAAPEIAGPLLLGVWCFTTALLARPVPHRQAVKVGLAAGFITALLCLLVLGALVVEQPDGDQPAPGFSGLRPGAIVGALGFLVTGTGIGAVWTFVGARWRAEDLKTHRVDWLAGFALVAAVAIVPLLLVGGAVTSTDAGMAIQGWPDSYGANMFLYPISLMSSPKRFLEHTHRLFGSLVGLTTLALMVYVLAAEGRRWVKAIAVVLFVAVCVQGAVGGMRVLESSRWLAMAHGVAAQLIFGLAVALAACLTPTFRDQGAVAAAPSDRRQRFLTTGLLHLMILQLVFGAMYRHMRSPHALWTHAGFSLVVIFFAVAAGFMLAARPTQPGGLARTLKITGRALVVVVALQFLLGWSAFALTGRKHESGSTAETLVRTAHQANGALLLGLVTLGFTWTRRMMRAARMKDE